MNKDTNIYTVVMVIELQTPGPGQATRIILVMPEHIFFCNI